MNSSCQDEFLENLRANRVPVAIFLKNGIRLSDVIVGIDRYCLFLTNQMIYKHTIATICPVEE